MGSVPRVPEDLMESMVRVLRFFRAVPPVPPFMAGTFVVLVLIAGTAVIREPSRAAGALAPVLLLQMLAAASGFSTPARRGHYDLLLTGEDRLLVALVHWLASVAPGLASWLALACVELAVAGTRGSLLTSGTLGAMAIVSTLPWALTVGLPRFSAGIGWLLILTTASRTFAIPMFEDWAVGPTRADLASAAFQFLLNPSVGVGQSLTDGRWLAAVPAGLLAVTAMCVAVWWVSRADVPLEAAQ